MMKALTRILAALMLATLTSCGKSEAQTPRKTEPELKILSFFIKEYPGAEVVIDDDAHTVTARLAYGAYPGKAHIKFTVNDGVTAEPPSGSEVDLSAPVSIFLTDVDGNAKKYIVNAVVSKSPYVRLTKMLNKEYLRTASIDGVNIRFKLPVGADLKSLTFEATADEGVTFDPDIAKPMDLTSPVRLKAVAPDGVAVENFIMSAEVESERPEVRGIYLPSPSHTSSFITYSDVCKSVAVLDELNFNCLFVCAWAATKAAWDSDVLKTNSSWSSARAGNMYANYTGGSGDALADIISEAHKKNIKVILWFEYGFMSSTGGVNMSDPVLSRHPDWIGRSNDGGYANYNGTDYYLNGYSSEVQNFMMSLMKEALTRYPDVDGIQGDDRMPAMPRNSGYEESTKAAYRAEKGTEPPSDPSDAGWVRWRLDRLNSFASAMHKELKAIKPNLIVCFAPNKYPWCITHLMQEWPVWIKEGNVDLLTVQCYVTATYENDVKTAMSYARSSGAPGIVNPAMILKNGSAVMSKSMLSGQLQYNRTIGTCGESQFWFDGLKEDYVRDVFKAFYTTKASLPGDL